MCVGVCAHSSAVSVLVPSGRSCFQSKPFPADADASVNSTSDFLPSGMGDRIPGAGQLYALQRFTGQDTFMEIRIWKITHTHTYYHLYVRPSLRMEAWDGLRLQYTINMMMHDEVI